ncbi:PTS sugar transporter subunit IIA [Lactovum miscens]|uniref:PTS system mannose-specific IIA component n=1 Tax=Lactovum miscens TaxID=190387 RepID=A0A841C8Q9_9LACT|nr:PTS system fructose subfamily transporter subunit IIA [Lactovum miscens]MBB5887941.1 PTS system mannose-specific IIA component [Lactovum miscens]
MENRALLIITHGQFGIELVKSAEMIMGPQEDIKALALKPGDSVEDLRSEASLVVENYINEGKKVYVLCDLLGGSPSNVALYLLSKGVEKIFTGVNMPMLIEMLTFYKTAEDSEVLLNTVKNTAEEGIQLIDISFLKRGR